MTVKGVVLLYGAVYAFAALLRPEDARWVKGAPLKLFVGLFVIGMWAHIVWIPFLASLIAIPLFSKSRADAAAIYVVTFLALPVMYYKVAIGGHYLFAVTKYTFCAVGLLIAYLMRPHLGPRLHKRFDIPVILVLLLELAQARDPDSTEMLRQFLPVFFTIALPYYFLSRSLNTEEDVRRFVLAIALGGFVLALVATVEARTHWLVYKQVESYLGIGNANTNAYQQMRGGMLRAPGSFSESTSLGAFLTAATLAMFALRTSFASKRKWYIAVGIMFVGLIAPNSRNALMGLAIGLLLLDVYRRKWGPFFMKVGAAGGLYLVLLTTAQFWPYARNLIGKGEDTQSSNEYRLLLLRRGMEEIHKHPMLGTTLKKAMDNLQDIQQGQHIIDLVNGYITYGLTLGYMGMAGLFFVFASLALAMMSARRKLLANPVLHDLAALTFAVAGCMILIAAFTSFGGEGSTYFYLVAVLGSSLWALRRTASATRQGVAAAAVAAPFGIRAMILADREAARTRASGLSSAP